MLESCQAVKNQWLQAFVRGSVLQLFSVFDSVSLFDSFCSCMYVCMYVCMYHTLHLKFLHYFDHVLYIYIYIYIYIYTERERERERDSFSQSAVAVKNTDSTSTEG